jgi:preprotein translocase subunit SecE
MEVKKSNQQIVASSQKDISAVNWNPYEWLSQIKQEFFKITWTPVNELKVYTQIVVGATFFFGLGIFGIDLLIHTFLNGLASAIHLIGG